MIDGIKLAKYILQKSKKRLSNLELQKYLYITEVNFIKEFDITLIKDNFEAWQLGPVIIEVYLEYRNYGANSIDIPTSKIDLELEEKYINNINSSIEYCDKFIYWDLVAMIQFKDSAWDITVKKEPKSIIDKKYLKNIGLISKENLNKETEQ